MVPTRELANQVENEFLALKQNNYRTCTIYGGSSYSS